MQVAGWRLAYVGEVRPPSHTSEPRGDICFAEAPRSVGTYLIDPEGSRTQGPRAFCRSSKPGNGCPTAWPGVSTRCRAQSARATTSGAPAAAPVAHQVNSAAFTVASGAFTTWPPVSGSLRPCPPAGLSTPLAGISRVLEAPRGPRCQPCAQASPGLGVLLSPSLPGSAPSPSLALPGGFAAPLSPPLCFQVTYWS